MIGITRRSSTSPLQETIVQADGPEVVRLLRRRLHRTATLHDYDTLNLCQPPTGGHALFQTALGSTGQIAAQMPRVGLGIPRISVSATLT